MQIIFFLFLTFLLSVLLDIIFSKKTPTIQSFDIYMLEIEVEKSHIYKYSVFWGIIRMWIPTFTLVIISITFYGNLSIMSELIKINLKI